MSDKHIYIDLNYSHEEIISLLDKIKSGQVLSEAQYNKLIKEIGLNNISTFDGYYDSLKNKPNLNEAIEQYTKGKYVENEYISTELIPGLEQYIDNTTNSKVDQKADKVHTHDDRYFTKQQIEDMLRQIDVGDIDLTNYVTITQFLEELAKKANLDSVYNKEEVDDLLKDFKPEIDAPHDDCLTKEEADDLYASIEDAIDTLDAIDSLQQTIIKNKEEIQGNLDNAIQDVQADVSNSLSEFNDLLNNKADKDHAHDNVYTKSEVDDKLATLSGGGSIDLEGYAKQEDLDNLIGQINNKSDKNHTHDLSVKDIEGLQEILDNISNKDDVVDVPDNIMELLDQKASVDHKHNEYALVDHSHDNFADINHTHDELQVELNKKANIEDILTEEDIIEIIESNVDIEVDADHTHDEYALKEHEHDNYADKNHVHNEYANKEHSHDIKNITNLESELNKKANASMVYTKEEVDKKIVETGSGGVIDLEGYIKQSDLNAGLATKADVVHNHGISDIDGLQDILESKANAENIVIKTELEEALAGKADSEHIHEDYSVIGHTHEEFYTKEESDALIQDTFDENITEMLSMANIYTDDAIAALIQGAPEDMNDFAEVAKAIEDQNTNISDFEESMETALASKASTEHVHAEYATIEGEDEREIFRTTELTVSSLGGISAGSNLDGLTVKEILNKLLYPYVAPTISISGTPNGGVFEKGDKQTITSVKVVVTKRSEKITKVEVLQGSTVLVSQEDDSISNGGTFNYSVNIPVNSTNVQLTGKVTDASGTTRQSTTTAFTFVYPYYVGVCNDSDTINEALIKELTKRVETKGTKNISYTTNNQRMIFAYPKSYGSIKKILDPNSFDVTSTFTQMEVKITGLDGSVQTYYVYINGASSVEDFTMTFNY